MTFSTRVPWLHNAAIPELFKERLDRYDVNPVVRSMAVLFEADDDLAAESNILVESAEAMELPIRSEAVPRRRVKSPGVNDPPL